MSETKLDPRIRTCRLIADDMKNDTEKMEGQPFTGKNVAVAFGNQAAAIAALANILTSILTERTTIR